MCVCISALYSLNLPSCLYLYSLNLPSCLYLYSLNLPSYMFVSVLYIVSIYHYVCMYQYSIVSISRHVGACVCVCVCVCVRACVRACVCVCVCNIHTYMHTRMISFLFIMLCKFVTNMYIISHDMRKNMVSERGGGADKKKNKKNKQHNCLKDNCLSANMRHKRIRCD